MKILSAERWLAAVVDATNEVAETTFNSPPSEPESLHEIPAGREGALLAIHTPDEALHLGVLGTPDACRALAKALLGMEEEEEPEHDDIPDAVGEIVNIIAGIVQRTVDREEGKAVTLGYPVYLRGSIVSTHTVETVAARMNLGPALAELVVIRRDMAGPLSQNVPHNKANHVNPAL